LKFRIFLFVCLLSNLAQAQTFWGKYQGGANIDETLAVTGDDNGFTYTTGYFSSTAAINGIALSVTGLTDVFVSKVSTIGATQWSIRVGGTQSDRGLGIAVDPSGNVIVSGFYTGTMNFGGGVSLTANGNSQDAFVAKFSSAGNIIWARSGGSAGNSDRANAVTTDADGNIFITGQFTGDASFGAFDLTSTSNTNDIFIVKYDPDGTELWAKKGSGDALNRGLAIATDNQGAVYTTGQFSGNITFDNTYTNTILNALFLVKYSSSGVEEWFRYAGGSSQSIGYGITSDGTNVYLTGDFGETLTFFGGTGAPAINSGYDNAVFVAAYNQTGAYQWGSSQGSDSPVSARGISHRGGELAVVGWHECTFGSLSAEYGEGLFNSIGFKDVYAMRYNTSGAFLWARNFGSITDEIPSGVYILPDNLEVISGTFTSQIIFAIRHSTNPGGILPIENSPNPGLTYCGDPHYGEFSRILGSQEQDGFLAKAIDLERAPYDFYHREVDGACDVSIPESCITYPGSVFDMSCQESLIGCQPFSITATNFANFGSGIGYTFGGQWTPGGSGINQAITGAGEVSVVLTSTDGCDTSTASAFADIHPAPDTPLMSDDEVVNTQASSTFPITLCPGDTVLIWSDFGPEVVEYGWTGENVDPATILDDTLVVTMPGAYQMNVVNEFGCGASNFILVFFEDLPPDTIVPYLNFNTTNDTISICQGDGTLAYVLDSLTGFGVDPLGLTFNWTISPDGFIGGTSTGGIGVPGPGWYVISVEIETNENPCYEQLNTYFATDSVYIEIAPLPSVFLNLTGPAATCPGDSLMLYLETDGTLSFAFDVIENYGDSILVSGPGLYEVTATNSNGDGCQVIDVESIEIGFVTTPEIISVPGTAIICPGDSVLLVTDSPGNVFWQGPSGLAGTSDSIYVNESGLYFAEVVFYSGCALVSNTLQVAEYATPFISSSNAILCPGETIEISVVSTTGTVEWLAPLSGNETTQEVSEPGIYTAVVSGCGISTEVSILVELSEAELTIERANNDVVCAGDSILVIATPGLENYQWSPFGTGDSTYFYIGTNVQVFANDTNGCALVSNILNFGFEPIPPLPVFDFELVCEGELQEISINQGLEVTWIDGPVGEILSSQSIISISPFLSDTTLYAYLTSEFCVGPLDSITLAPKPFPEIPALGTNAPLCTGEQIEMVVINPQEGVNYFWTAPSGVTRVGDQVTYPSTGFNASGMYQCFASLDGCAIDPVSIEVELFQPMQVSLPADTAICQGIEYVLRPNAEFQSYLWQNGSTDSLFIPSESGEFFLTAVDFNGCVSYAFTSLLIVNCEVIIPNIFTPNGDGRNDTWDIFTELPGSFRAVVYNRWGQKVYESITSQKFWDGQHMTSDEPCPEGVYYYVVEVVNFEGILFEKTGPLTLIRN
jgi:gliding motility-associated-like protein